MRNDSKKLIAGCSLAVLTLGGFLYLNSSKVSKENKSEMIDSISFKSHLNPHNKKKYSKAEIQKVYEAISTNDVVTFAEFIKSGGSLDEKITVDSQVITLADAIVKHERTNLIQEVVLNTSFSSQEFDQELSSKKVDISGSVLPVPTMSAGVSLSAAALAPVLTSLSKNPNNKVTKSFIDENKSNPEVIKAMELAATKALPEVAATCDEDQIRFLSELGADPLDKSSSGESALGNAGKSKCYKAISYWKNEQIIDFDKKDEEGVSGFDVLSKFKDPELQSFTNNLQEAEIKEISAFKNKAPRVSFYKKRSPGSIIDPDALVEPELRPDEATETAEFSEFSD